MSPPEEIETLEKYIVRLRRRVEQQAMHVEGLADFPDIAKKAGEILVRETEDLRRALIRLEEVKAQFGRAARAQKEATPNNSDAA
jgi:hypothetical protein